ncbi:MAG: hypothetical protein CL521_04075 [Actinobacteria bacterium]|nr:hypothetical protein [Actinomycetota bacterium]
MTYNKLFISDLHIGSNGFKDSQFKSFLSSLSCEHLYIVGDAIDSWLIKNPQTSRKHLQDLLQHLQHKCQHLTLVIGNHDHTFTDGLAQDNLSITDELIIETKNKKKFLVLHGHQFDDHQQNIPWHYYLVNRIYEYFLCFSKALNSITKKSSSILDRWIYQSKVWVKKRSLKSTHFYPRLHRYLDEKNVNGIIYGHTHIPEKSTRNNQEIFNTGDWIFNCSYLIENKDGELELHYFKS